MFGSRTRRWASPGVFAGIVVAFLLPFATVSCDGEEVTFTGAELALQRVPEEAQIALRPLADDVESESSHGAVIALAAAVAGSLSGSRDGAAAGSPRPPVSPAC